VVSGQRRSAPVAADAKAGLRTHSICTCRPHDLPAAAFGDLAGLNDLVLDGLVVGADANGAPRAFLP
jgi:hypothetical protein